MCVFKKKSHGEVNVGWVTISAELPRLSSIWKHRGQADDPPEHRGEHRAVGSRPAASVPRCQQAAVPARGPAPPLRARGSARVRGRGSRPLLAIWPRQRRLGLCHRPTRAGWKIQFARFNKKCCRAAAQVKTTVQLFANALCEVKHKNNAWKQHSLLAFCLPFERGVRLA